MVPFFIFLGLWRKFAGLTCLGLAGLAMASTALAQAPLITAVSAPRQVVAIGQNLTLSVTAANATGYQWKRNGLPIPGATNASYTITAAIPYRDNGWYQAVATNGGVSTTSAVVFVNVAVTPSNTISIGSNTYGQTTTPSGLTSVVSVGCGELHSVALKSDGTLSYWGYRDFPESVLSGLSGVVAVAAGGAFNLALRSDGTVVAIGRSGNPQSIVPTGLNGVVAVAAGTAHSLALRSNGTVVAWGGERDGLQSPPPGLSGVVAIACGNRHSVALKEDGSVVVWGDSSSGQTNVPAGLTGVVAVAASMHATLALKNDGTVVGWGTSYAGLLRIPEGLQRVVAIAIGGSSFDGHCLALRNDGTVVAWGTNTAGQTQVAGLGPVVAIAAGSAHSVILRSASGDLAPAIGGTTIGGRAYNLGEKIELSTSVSAGTSMNSYQWRKNGAAIAGATSSRYVIDGAEVGSGGNYDVVVSNSLGSATSSAATVSINPAPVVSATNRGRYVLAPGGNLRLELSDAIDAAATVRWKRSGRLIPGATGRSFALSAATPAMSGYYQAVYQVGSTTTTSAPIFVIVAPTNTQVVTWGGGPASISAVPSDLTTCVAVASSTNYLALKADGTVARPNGNVLSVGLANVVAVAQGNAGNIALKADGSVVQWTSAGVPTTANPVEVSDVVDIAAGTNHFLALRADGTVHAWGDSASGGTAVPAGLAGAVAIAGGVGFSLALLSDGTVVGWGANESGQSSAPAGLNNVVAIAAGLYHSLALKADGTVVAWGSSAFGGIAVPGDLRNVAGIAAGGWFSVALKTDGTIVAWGNNADGLSTPPGSLAPVLAIAAGNSRAAVLRDASGDLPPSIGNQPVGVTGFNGQEVKLRVTVNAGTTFLNYQWRKDGVALAGATAATLTLPKFGPTHAGNYDVVVTSRLGSVTSTTATVAYSATPALSVNLTGRQVITPGQSVTLAATSALTGPVTYQWRRDGRAIAGATTASLSITRATRADSGVYQVVVTGASGTATSAPTFVMVPQTTRLVAWGDGSSGKTTIPAEARNVVAVAAGLGHSLALRSDGTVVVWGEGQMGEANIPRGLADVAAIAAGYTFSMALKGDGTVVCWGLINYTPSGLGDVIAIATAGTTAMALKSDGTVVEWRSANLPSEVPAGLGNVVAIAGAVNERFAIKADGYVVTWGGNADRKNVVPAGLNEVRGIAGGFGRFAALKSDGTIVHWGDTAGFPPAQSGFAMIASSATSFVGVKADGTVSVWGNAGSSISQLPPGLSKVFSVSLGSNHALALRDASSDVAPAISGLPIVGGVAGQPATLRISAAGEPAPSYQWRYNGTAIPGATAATYTLTNAQRSAGGSFDVVVSNYVGSVTSAAVTVTPPGRISNLSVLTSIAAAGDSFTMGYVVGGAGTAGAKPLVIRAAGPSLGALGVDGTLADPKLELFAGPGRSGENDNWGGSGQLAAAFGAVGAFPFVGPTSRDAALTTNIFTRDNTVSVSAAGDGTGTGLVIAEIYDATRASDFTISTPRLINVSVRKHLGTGLTVGFVLGGGSPTKILIRGIGPTLGAFGVPGVVADPQLTLFNSVSTKIGENDDWGGTSELVNAFAAVGAFVLTSTSKDAALLATLPPGNYSVEVKGVSNTTGEALIEVYEVP